MVRVDRHDAVVVITLDRPDVRNALDHPTLLRLIEIQREIQREIDDTIDAQIDGSGPEPARAVVLAGSPPTFCAGADLNGVDAGEFAADLARVLQGFGALPVPVIAVLDGHALGAGAQLAVAADLRVSTPDCVVGIPAARLGLVVDHWTVRRLASEFTAPVARSMLVAAETYSGQRLEALGGVHRIGGFDDALAWARELAGFAPLTMAAHKRALEHAESLAPADDAFEEIRRRAWASDDADEGRSAFLEKRPARFTGR